MAYIVMAVYSYGRGREGYFRDEDSGACVDINECLGPDCRLSGRFFKKEKAHHPVLNPCNTELEI